MVRTQIYLTESQQASLRAMAGSSGRKQSELIREAIDRYVADSVGNLYQASLRKGAGMWRDRSDLPDFTALRSEADRFGRD